MNDLDSQIKLAVFDIDGTISDNGFVSQNILNGIKHLQNHSIITTVATGRGYIRAKELLGLNFDQIISKNALLILENGSKITDKAGSAVFAEYLKQEEINDILDFAQTNDHLFKLIWFNPLDVSGPVKVWCYNETDINQETKKRGHYADVFHCPFDELRSIILSQPLSSITLKLLSTIEPVELKRKFKSSSINMLLMDQNVEFIKNTTNKSIAINYLLNKYKINKNQLLIAGNDINDIDMLEISAAKRILVGNTQNREIVINYLSDPSKLIKLDNIEALGEYLWSVV